MHPLTYDQHTDPTTISEDVAAEISALQSIYGEDALHPWAGTANSNTMITRYELETSIPGVDEQAGLKLLISLPLSYPTSSPPQIQLLSKYIGPFGCDSQLFGSILRIYLSKDGVKWSPGDPCVFEGIEAALERCLGWYNDRLESRQPDASVIEHNALHEDEDTVKDGLQHADVQQALPAPIFYEADPIVDRKSIFIGRACHISHPNDVQGILSQLLSDKRTARATHPIINAWRCRVDGVLHQDNDDDGENAAGGRLAHLLQILGVEYVLVIVTRYYGGIQLGPDRFKHINQAARNALEKGGFLNNGVAMSKAGPDAGKTAKSHK